MAITFIIPGQEQLTRSSGAPLALPAGLTEGTIKHSVQVAVQRGGAAGEVSVSAEPGTDIVAIYVANGPVLLLHPESAQDLFLAQSSPPQRSGQSVANGVRVPAVLQWDGLANQNVTTSGATRGFIGKVFVGLIQIITSIGKDSAAHLTAALAVKKVDSQVDPGLYRLNAKVLNKLKGTQSVQTKDIVLGAKPMLVLLHGTFSNTQGTFGKLWAEHPAKVASLFQHYSGVYALEHPTLGASPIQNAMELASVLPDGAEVHLLSHSRGGLVGEVLARVCGDADLKLDDFSAQAPGADYQQQREDLQQLIGIARRKKLKVKRFVRVACPARGTLLASSRLDAYLSVFKWSMELIGLPVLPEMVGFLAEVAKSRTDPESIPGLAAQMPQSPLVQWLHAIEGPIAGQLRVIAGDMEGDSVVCWLKTLLSDTYFWTDNDLVVQTSSMYGGAPRNEVATFVLDRGSGVSHFSYFSNPRTAEAIVNGLVLDDPQGFRPIGPLSWEGRSASGDRGRASDKPMSDKPAVFILPGILGSNLKVDDRRIWVGPWLINGLDKLAYQEGMPDEVKPDGLVNMVYEDLAKFLGDSHQVIEFGYDWRLPLENEAVRLADAVQAALDARQTSGQPVRLLAHSMGGMLARTFLLERPLVWKRMMDHPRACLLMLGTPNGGSWAPMQVLSGDDSFGNGLAFAGAPFRANESRQLMANFPGFIQLQASLLDPVHNLADTKAWQALADRDRAWLEERSRWHRLPIQKDYYAWGVPTPSALKKAVSLREKLDKQDMTPYCNKMLLVVGHAQFTPDGYEIDPQNGFNYLDAQHGGDGRVTLRSALLPGVRTWTLDCAHGDLPKQKSAFKAFLSLLKTSRTTALKELSSSISRGTVEVAVEPTRYVRRRPAWGNIVAPPLSVDQMFGVVSEANDSRVNPELPSLAITVINCNLKFTRDPLIIGHYVSTDLTGSERVVDEMVGGLLADALKIGLYPLQPCSNQVFMNISINGENPLQLPRPEAAIVVGLGAEGKLRSSDLIQTVRQGVLAWAQRLVEQHYGVPVHFEIASALLGSGGTGMSPGQAAGLIAQGVREANKRLQQKSWPIVNHLHLTELYLDRATEAWRAVQVLGISRPNEYVVTPTIQRGTGWLRRPLEGGYRSTSYDFISAITEYDQNNQPLIAYTLDTKRARAEVRAHATQGALLRELVSSSSNQRTGNSNIGQILFKLLIPIEMDAYLSGSTEFQMELDSSTAGIPWELLDTVRERNTSTYDLKMPWSIRAKLLRKLRTQTFRTQVADATPEADVLIIGEPATDTTRYPRLPGARAEARAIAELFKATLDTDRVNELIAEDTDPCLKVNALAVTSALLERDWRIVHIAGHGEPPELEGALPKKAGAPEPKILDPRGVVLSNDIFLGPREMQGMRVVPELVFINCCHLAAADSADLQKLPHLCYDRARFAATVAEALIGIGVRCVIAAGWAVEDGPASEFATSFYTELLLGRRFIDAVAAAREAAWLNSPSSNTWAAYQCYGDPDWVFVKGSEDANQPEPITEQGLDSIASAQALIVALELAVDDSRYKKVDRGRVLDTIEYLEARFGQIWGEIGEVGEAFAQAWAEAGDTEKAIAWFEQAIGANDGSASLKASEQLGELRARMAWAKVTGAAENNGEQLVKVLSNARKETADAIEVLTRVYKVQPTLGRTSLCGAAYKRLAMIELLANDAQAEQKALEQMKAYYSEAEAQANTSDAELAYHPTLERIAAELFSSDSARIVDELENFQQRLNLLVKTNPDFENVVALILANLYQALADKKLEENLPMLLSELDNLHARVPAILKWSEVQSQAEFVLWRYARQAEKAESAAVQVLNKRLKEWVQPASK
ncbi:CHAT domain-containing protein [Azotobacter beijerinckii]|uniref:CHAT domain-containing protein n=1 Tax=Azotobacter beijerinckii TaxID=170623 RepID=A0A1H9RK96_9GAMM|nr:CHAT domain-containing protein [Azotobacter beijerinckii]SER72965.1 CHAT domain-containing protein [Azotobacter beijerinckii]